MLMILVTTKLALLSKKDNQKVSVAWIVFYIFLS